MAKAFVINTNKKEDTTLEDKMLNEKFCAAYNGYWKFYIDALEIDDVVFLYSSRRGIIAMGIASGVLEVESYDGKAGETHKMKLNQFNILNKDLDAKTIKEIIGYDIKLNETVTFMAYKYGSLIIDYINSNCL